MNTIVQLTLPVSIADSYQLLEFLCLIADTSWIIGYLEITFSQYSPPLSGPIAQSQTCEAAVTVNVARTAYFLAKFHKRGDILPPT